MDERWARPEAAETANVLLLEALQSHQTGNTPLLAETSTALLELVVRPAFSNSKIKEITLAGRKAHFPQPAQPTRSDEEILSKPWKYRDPAVVTIFRWCLCHLEVRNLVFLCSHPHW